MKIRTNKDRAIRAGLTLHAYLQGDSLDESTARDLITDLFHFMHSREKNITDELRMILCSYIDEVEEEGGNVEQSLVDVYLKT